VRLPGDAVGGNPSTWQSREDSWTSFRRTRGKEALHLTGKATVNGGCVIRLSTFSFTKKYAEAFWVDLVIHNPFNAEVNLSDLTVIVTGHIAGSEWTQDLVDVEVLGEIVLDPKETRTVNIVSLFKRMLQANFLYLIRSQCQF
jgi:trafficking protein particle complex subunit 8